MSRTQLLTFVALSSWMNTSVAAGDTALTQILRWQKKPQLICRGEFLKTPDIAKVKRPPSMSEAQTTITAQQGTSFSQTGTSNLQGSVVIRQEGRELRADRVSLLRDPQSKKISKIELKGNISFEEHDRLMTGHLALADLMANTISTKESAYRMDHPTPLETLHAWGVADTAVKDRCGNIHLTQTTYSVCPISNPTWHIRASKINVNKETGVASAKHARFYLYSVPIMYVPWISYPIKKERKSGFLLPNININERDGLNLDIPYYLNLAPNYDGIISINPMTKRGVKFNGQYRYLTQQNRGKLNLGFIPRDREFRNFQHNAPDDYGNKDVYRPYLSRIKNASSDRFGGFYQNNTTFDCHFAGSVQMAYVSDDYYLRDFGSDPITNNKNQLLNQAELRYFDEHWQMLGRIQGYQTLHPVTSMNPEPYSRLPQIVALAHYPHHLMGLDYELAIDYTNFDRRRDFITNEAVVSAHRLHVRPGVGIHWQEPWGFLNPEIRLDATNYWLKDQAPQSDDAIHRVLPIASIDSGLIFERQGTCFRQTLEPRLYYLWVPRENQDDIPNFDTSLPRYSFEQFFHYNRFTGLDRIGDANQVTLGLSSRWYEQNTGIERFTFSMGLLYQFQKRSVSLKPDLSDDPTRNSKLSPLLMSATYRFSTTIYTQGDLSWNPQDNRTETGYVRLHYEPEHNQIFHIGYDFVREGDNIPDHSNKNLSRIDIGVSWPLGRQWHVLANWNYNLSHNHIEHYFGGIKYDSCCWAVRAIASRTNLTSAFANNSDYNMRYYLEIKLKGLGTLGNASPSTLLDQSIVGFKDNFR